jgi:uncharacterized protein (TIRG00374 family)
MCLLAGLIALEHAAYRPLIYGLMAVVAALIIITRLPYLPRWLQSIGDSGRYRRLTAPLATLANLLRSSRRLLQPKPAAFGLVIALIAWGAEGLGFYLICQGLHTEVNPGTAIGIYAIASLAGSAAFFLPAGIGGMEIVMTTLMLAQGAPLSTAVIATLLCRIATLWFAVLIGIAASAVIEFQIMPKPIRSPS